VRHGPVRNHLIGGQPLGARLWHCKAHLVHHGAKPLALGIFKQGGAEAEQGPQMADEGVRDRDLLAVAAPFLVPGQQQPGLDIAQRLGAVLESMIRRSSMSWFLRTAYRFL
jgi:hypothetical protein